MMPCRQARSLFSSYLDGAVSGAQMRSIREHLLACPACSRDYALLEGAQALVASIGRQQPPPELALRLSVALSRQRSSSLIRSLQAFAVRSQNALSAFMVPATAGLLTTVMIFAVLIPFLVPAQLAAANDVPSTLYSPPKLSASPLYGGLGPVDVEAPVVVETYVDANGRVQDYRIISGRDTQSLRTELNRTLIFTVFEPATAFGRPVPGRAVLSFSNVNVRG